MARTVLTVMKADRMSEAAEVGTFVSMLATPNSTDGAEFELGKDHKTMILLVNDGSSAASATSTALRWPSSHPARILTVTGRETAPVTAFTIS